MPFEDPWLREGKTSPLEFERRLHAQTGNAIHDDHRLSDLQ